MFMQHFKRSHLLIGLLVAAASLGLAACGDDDEEGEKGTTVNVTLSEFIVDPSPASAPAGDVTFVAKNEGKEKHELVIVKTDLAPDKLPTKADGSVDEEGAGVAVVDEIEEFQSGGTEELTVKLDPGKYVLLCNIVEEDESHYQEGMHAPFSVQ